MADTSIVFENITAAGKQRTFDLVQKIRLGPVNIQREKPRSDP